MRRAPVTLCLLTLLGCAAGWGCSGPAAPADDANPPAESQSVAQPHLPQPDVPQPAPPAVDLVAPAAGPTDHPAGLVATPPEPTHRADRPVDDVPVSLPNVGPPGEQPAAVFTARSFAQAFRRDFQGFIARYRGKLLQVSGKVTSFGYHSSDDYGYLIVDGLKFDCQDRQPIATALPGQTAVLHGRCDDNGVLAWDVVAGTGDPPPTLTAEQLAQAFAANPADAKGRLNDSYVIVTGRIAKVADDGGSIYLTPPGNQPVVRCYFGSSTPREAARNKAFQPGQVVRIVGSALLPELLMCDSLPTTAPAAIPPR